MGVERGKRGKAISERGATRNKGMEVITGRPVQRSAVSSALPEYLAFSKSIREEAVEVGKNWATKQGLKLVLKPSI